VYRAVDEFAINEAGDALPVEERVRLFHFLCEEVMGADGRVAPADLHKRLARYSG